MRFLVIGVITLICAMFLLVVLTASMEAGIQEKKNPLLIFPGEFWVDLKLLLKTIFRLPKNKVELLKHLQQVGLYFLEIFTVCGVFLIIGEALSPLPDTPMGAFWFGQAERFLLFYTAYQVFVYGVLSLIQSARKDSFLAAQRIIKLAKLYLTGGDEEAGRELHNKIDGALNPYTFTVKKAKELILDVKDILGSVNPYRMIDRLDFYMVQAEHYAGYESLFWRFSFLLRALK